MTARSRRKAREDAANYYPGKLAVERGYDGVASSPSPGGQDDYLRQQAFGLVGGVGQGEAAKSKVAEAEAVFRWLKYGPEKPADPTVQQIVADVVNSERGLRHSIDSAHRAAREAQATAEKALTEAKDIDGGLGFTALIAVLALVVGVAALIIAIFL